MAVIDFAKVGADLKAVTALLKRYNLPTDLGEANRMLARSIRDHKHLETILTSCTEEERHLLYESVRPNLRFTAWPLDKYVASAGQRAEREQWHVLSEDGQLQEFKPAQDIKSAEKAIAQAVAERTLVLVCARCREEGRYEQVGLETPVAVRTKAVADGWSLFPVISCPKCTSRNNAA